MQTRLLFLLFILVDLGLSAIQYNQLSFDGDLVPITLPAGHYEQVLEDPLGLDALLHGENYAGAGRSFSHWWLKAYFDLVPRSLGCFLGPIDSLYAAAALFRLLAHIWFAWLLMCCLHPFKRAKDYRLWAIFAGLAFLQYGGFNRQIGIIDPSVTYTAFYAWPMLLLLWWWQPFFRAWLAGRPVSLSRWSLIVRFVTSIPLALSGPLITPTVFVLCAALAGNYLLQNWRTVSLGQLLKVLPRQQLCLISCLLLCCTYGYWLSTHNLESLEQSSGPTLWERYALLPAGIWYQLSIRLALLFMLLALLLQYQLMRRWLKEQEQLLFKAFYRLFLLFSLLYLLLLPLGGYRSYRPNLIRSDTQMPITIGAIFLLVGLAWRLWQAAPLKWRLAYRIGWMSFLLLFINGDLTVHKENECEYALLQELSTSKADIPVLSDCCNLLSWDPIYNAVDSRLIGKSLYNWGITTKPQFFLQEEGSCLLE